MNISDITSFIKYKSNNKKTFFCSFLEAVLKLIDVDINVLHKNTAARKKSALRNALNLVQVG